MLAGSRVGVLLVLVTALYLLGVHFVASNAGSDFNDLRWDGVHYVSISEQGFELHPCGAELEARGIKICGNPWYPGWPYFLRLFTRGLSWIGLTSVQWISGLVVFIFLINLIALSWQSQVLLNPAALQNKQIGIGASLWAALWMFVQPGSFYYFTAFPYTFAIFCCLFSFLLNQHLKTKSKPTLRRISDLLAFGASFSYPTAIFAVLLDVPPMKTCFSKDGFRALLWRGFVYLLGTLVLAIIFKVLFSNFWLYFDTQAQYPRTPGSPLVRPFSMIYDLIRGHEHERLVFLWYGFGLLLVALRLPDVFKLRSFWFINAIFFFTFFIGSWASIYRYYLLMFPMGALIGATPVSVWVKVVYFMMGLFLQFGKLLPSYLSGNLI